MLDHIVAVLVLDESLDVSVELLQDGVGLVARAVLQDPLDDPAAVGMGGEVVHLPAEGVNDELEPGGLHGLDTFLHHVVPVLVLHALENISVQFLSGRKD